MSNDVPRAVRALWNLDDDTPRRGPKPALTLGDIAAAGIECADAEGLDGVSMAALAKRLGFTTMALYRYVDSKDTLLALMVDAAFGPAPEALPDDWRLGLTGWATEMLSRLRAHPWVVHVGGSPPLTPNAIAWMNAGLEVLAGTGIDSQRAGSTLLVIDGYVRNYAVSEQMYAGAATLEWGATLRTLVQPGQFPAVHDALTEGVFDGEGDDQALPTDQFEFGLGLILDGIGRLTDG